MKKLLRLADAKVLLSCMLLTIAISTTIAQPDIPVDHTTGRAIVSVPIWSLTSGSISSPVSLVYAGGGIKVGSPTGEVGVGWSLAAGGRITRILKGIPDDYVSSTDPRKGWLWDATKNTIASFAPTADANCNDWTTFSNLIAGPDTEPDVFVISAAGLSAKFVFGNDGVIRLMPWQDLKITYTVDAVQRISEFKVVTNLGVTYTFGLPAVTTRSSERVIYQNSSLDSEYNNANLTFNSSWNLISIVGASNEKISFRYGVPTLSYDREYRRHVKSTLDNIDTLYWTDDLTETMLLDSISSPTTKIIFNRGGESVLIGSIDIQSLVANQSKTINLVYQSIANSAEPGSLEKVAGSRNYLSKIVEQKGCNAFPAFELEYYYPERLPYQKSFPVDLFGYYNGKSVLNSKLAFLPPVYEMTTGTDDGETYRFYPAGTHSTLLASTSRDVDGTKSYYGSLKAITYPSGGRAEITWEPNQYRDTYTNTDRLGAGIRVAQIRIKDDADGANDIVKNYSYKKADNTSSGSWLYNPSFAFREGGTSKFISPDNLAPDETILYERVTVSYPGNGKSVFDYLVSGKYDAAVNSSGDWSATKVRLVSNPLPSCPPQGNLSSGYYVYPFAESTNYDFEQGLVSKVSTYNEGGTLLKEQSYTYQRLNNPNAITVKGLRYEKTQATNTYAYALYSYLTNVGKVVQTETVKAYDMVNTSLNHTIVSSYTFSPTTNLLTEQSITNSDGKVLKTQYRYAVDYPITTPSGTNATMIKKLQTLNMHGTTIETISINDVTTIGASLTLFDDYGTQQIYPRYAYSWAGTGSFTPSAVTGSPQVFSYDAGYYQTSNIESVNSKGMPTNVKTVNQSIAGIIYGKGRTTPSASIQSARTTEVLFSDFENTENYQIAAGNSTNVWTGTWAYQTTNGVPIAKSGITKTTSARYRFRCRAFATTATNISLTVQLSTASGWYNTVVTYPSAQSGNWILLEAFIPMSTVQSTFTVQLVSNSSALVLDDIALHPESSQLQNSITVDLLGVTSLTDNRGLTTFQEYDANGRLAYIRNTNREIVQQHLYDYQTAAIMRPIARFSCNATGQPLMGETVTFTAAPNACIATPTYKWEVNGVVQGSTTSTLSYTFPSFGEYSVRLTVSASGFGTNTMDVVYTVKPPPLGLDMTMDGNDYIAQNCDVNETFQRTFHATNVTGCIDGPVFVDWYSSTDNVNWTLLQTYNSISTPFVYNIPQGASDKNYWIKCVVRSRCGTGGYQDPSEGEDIIMVTFDYCI